MIGSSPRVWRHAYWNYGVSPVGRFISTGVETCIHTDARSRLPAVHLHGCGDMVISAIVDSLTSGSSPRVWRHEKTETHRRPGTRFISTGVETCFGKYRGSPECTVHLHGCGDMRLRYMARRRRLGSSPRVWRHGSLLRLLLGSRRFISTGVET